MVDSRAALLRRLWLKLHLWIGVGLGLLIVPIALSGCVLVFHDDIDAWINPARYAVSGSNVALPPSAYLDSASRALPGDRAAQWFRWIHEGSHSGPVWRIIVFLCGLAPPVFVMTGIVMWLRKRTGRSQLGKLRDTQLRPAE